MDFSALTAAHVTVLYDMCMEWEDKDRHGQLASEWSYDEWELNAFHELSEIITQAARLHGIVYF